MKDKVIYFVYTQSFLFLIRKYLLLITLLERSLNDGLLQRNYVV